MSKIVSINIYELHPKANRFLSKFGIYSKQSIPTSLFVSGNFDLQNTRGSFYEISGSDKFNIEDVNFIETEFNDLMFENNSI